MRFVALYKCYMPLLSSIYAFRAVQDRQPTAVIVCAAVNTNGLLVHGFREPAAASLQNKNQRIVQKRRTCEIESQ